jgi:hypothetical protein
VAGARGALPAARAGPAAPEEDAAADPRPRGMPRGISTWRPPPYPQTDDFCFFSSVFLFYCFYCFVFFTVRIETNWGKARGEFPHFLFLLFLFFVFFLWFSKFNDFHFVLGFCCFCFYCSKWRSLNCTNS